jgi:hypothetical protein
MADIYVEAGPMSYSKDTTKVPVAYAVASQKIIRTAVIAAIDGTKGFTSTAPATTPPSPPKGYGVDLTLSEISYGTYQDRPSVTAKFMGTVITVPEKKMLTNMLTGKGTVGSGGKTVSDGDVRAAIEEGVKATMVKSVLPYLSGNP